ncbi:MAG: DUF5684 domain-containing protein [Rikenellaceae bacterium]|jgi:hypothetical protein|nr:DUF5684 domain-containing protein [Rikenellaceae bacterium]
MTTTLFPSWMLVMYSIIWTLIAALMLVSLWRLFVKMGQPGWKGIVPFYNLWTAIKVLKKPVRWFWIVVGAYLLCRILSLVMLVGAVTLIEESSSGAILSVLVFSLLCLVAAIVWLVYWILLMRAWARSFGHGDGFTVGLVLLPVVFLPILAFGDSAFTEP